MDVGIWAKQLSDLMDQAGMSAWSDVIADQLQARLVAKPHGDMLRWQQGLAALPVPSVSHFDLNTGLLQIGAKPDSEVSQRDALAEALKAFHPWRKGPYLLHGVFVDTEWRSDWKWDRLVEHLQPLQDRKVLDVGCGNGYHLWRIAAQEASLVIGIDPTQLFMMQFRAVARLLAAAPEADSLLKRVHHLPLGIEDVPAQLQAFDTVFSMGVLYHRRSPLDHLKELKDTLRPGGELVLETLVVDGDVNTVLMPEGRYAKMRNVWFIPSVAMLELWLRRAGFKQVRTVDETVTSLEEQRSTEWMQFESLVDFLDPADKTRTAEGYPAPKRAVVLATA